VTWNYRVIQRDESFSIQEVYYGDDDEIQGFSNDIALVGENVEDLKADLELMVTACDKPVLNYYDLRPERKFREKG
jgi:hypothetical protein